MLDIERPKCTGDSSIMLNTEGLIVDEWSRCVTQTGNDKTVFNLSRRAMVAATSKAESQRSLVKKCTSGVQAGGET